jgi:hypothetical protein
MNAVRWFSKDEITFLVSELLEGFEQFVGRPIEPPLPVEEMIERYLGISMEYDDLKSILDLPDVLGATWIQERKIVIDKTLLDKEQRGRMFFTMAHEVGHWALHRKIFAGPAARRSCRPDIVCRESGIKARGEWQADYFAAALLMPEMPVRSAFASVFGPKPLEIFNHKSIAPKMLFHWDLAWEHANEVGRLVIEQGRFTNVSKIAMRIRLQELGCLINRTPERMAASA